MLSGITGYLLMAITRDLELRLHGHLREITLANDDVIGSRQGFPPTITAYEKTLRSVAECATVNELDEIAEHIKDQIRNHGQRLANRRVRRTARTLISQVGYPADDFLNAA